MTLKPRVEMGAASLETRLRGEMAEETPPLLSAQHPTSAATTTKMSLAIAKETALVMLLLPPLIVMSSVSVELEVKLMEPVVVWVPLEAAVKLSVEPMVAMVVALTGSLLLMAQLTAMLPLVLVSTMLTEPAAYMVTNLLAQTTNWTKGLRRARGAR